MIDDLDESVLNHGEAKHVLFAVDGREYEIDLSADNAMKLSATFAPYVAAARRTGSQSTASARRSPESGAERLITSWSRYGRLMTPIYGPRGDVVAWMEDGDCIRDLHGAVVGWLYDDAVHGRRGQHAGYFNDGLFRDNGGAVVAWIEGASGGPVKPVRHVRPVTPVRQVRPVRAVRHVRHVRAVRQIAWSTTTFSEWLPLS